MKKIAALLLAAVFTTGLLAACGGNTSSTQPASTGGETSVAGEQAPEEGGEDNQPAGEGGQLNLFTWEGMFPQELLDGFEAETGYRVNYVNFDWDETMLARLEAAGGGDYDVIIADDYIIETVIAEGLAQKLNTGRLANYGNINPIYQGQFYDPTDEYTVPYGAGVQTIVYDPSAVDVTINGYEDLWDEALRDNIGIIANYRVVNGMALKVLGESYNTEDAEVLERAGTLLQDLAPNIRLIKDDNIQDDLVSGEIAAAVMYTSQVTMAKLANPALEVVYPSEGIGFGIMAAFVPSEAPNAEAAYAFLDYLLDAENAAQGFEYIGYYSTNSAADALIADEYKDFLTLPEGFKAEDTEMIQNVSGDAEEIHSRIWTEFKTATGQ